MVEISKQFAKFIEIMKNLKGLDEYYKYMVEFSKLNFFIDQENPIFSLNESDGDLFDQNLDFSINMLSYPPQTLMTLNKILPEFDNEKWLNFLNSLNFENAVFYAESPNFKTEETTKIVSENEIRNIIASKSKESA